MRKPKWTKIGSFSGRAGNEKARDSIHARVRMIDLESTTRTRAKQFNFYESMGYND